MARKKLQHFDDISQWDHCYEYGAETAGKWGDRVILELGCGHGAYTVALAEKFPDTTLVGVDIKGARMWHGASKSKELGLKNVRFLRVMIEDLEKYFNKGEVDEIWITFPDPHPRKGKAKKRLTSQRFLDIYKKILKPGGIVHFKTDDKALFDYSKEVIPKLDKCIEDLYAAKNVDELLLIQTPYEKRHLAAGRTIYYLSFGL